MWEVVGLPGSHSRWTSCRLQGAATAPAQPVQLRRRCHSHGAAGAAPSPTTSPYHHPLPPAGTAGVCSSCLHAWASWPVHTDATPPPGGTHPTAPNRNLLCCLTPFPALPRCRSASLAAAARAAPPPTPPRCWPTCAPPASTPGCGPWWRARGRSGQGATAARRCRGWRMTTSGPATEGQGEETDGAANRSTTGATNSWLKPILLWGSDWLCSFDRDRRLEPASCGVALCGHRRVQAGVACL